MMKIKTIGLYNYRAFYQQHVLSVEGKNILIYGENGSGKSSLYKALEDFFAAAHQSKSIAANIFDANSPSIKIVMDTDESFVYQHDSTLPKPIPNFLIDTHRHNPFFTYKRLLRAYLSENEANRPDVFSILIETILPYHTNEKSGQTFEDDWKNLNQALQLKASTSEYKDAINTTLPNFNNGLGAFLEDLAAKTNDWLNRYFKHHVTIAFDNPTLTIRNVEGKKVFANKEITLRTTYFGKSLPTTYYEFFNEARLSAFAICLYLASLKIISEPPDYKLLFLDDIFIGLDMSNRIPLLRILQDNFGDYQIFLTTYDRTWFEVMREYFKGDRWKAIEMYAHENNNDGNPFEVPIIVDSLKDYIEKADEYFKIKDYPACGNYLRKALEKQIKAILPIEYKITQTEDFGTRDLTHLETLINNLERFFNECNEPLPAEVQEGIKLYKTLVLNPLSHDDPKSSIYKIEIENTFTVIRKLRNLPPIKRVLLLPVHAKITYANPAHVYTAEIELADNLFIVTKGTDRHFAQCTYWLRKWTFQGVDWRDMRNRNNQPHSPQEIKAMCERKRTIEEIYHGICQSLGIPENPYIYEEFQVGDRGSLQDMLNNLV